MEDELWEILDNTITFGERDDNFLKKLPRMTLVISQRAGRFGGQRGGARYLILLVSESVR